MKKGIHPDYHFVDVQLEDGTTYKTRTTYGTAGQKVTLDIDPSTHPAWTGGQQQLMDRGGRLTRFNKKFAGFVKGWEKEWYGTRLRSRSNAVSKPSLQLSAKLTDRFECSNAAAAEQPSCRAA